MSEGTYGVVHYQTDDARLLMREMAHQGIPNLLDFRTYHTTVIYSRSKLDFLYGYRETDWPKIGISLGEVDSWVVRPVSFELFDAHPKSTKRALVMKLDAPEILSLHYKLRVLGATHDYSEFVPHLTLSYNVPADLDLTRLTVDPCLALRVKSLNFEPLDD